VVPRLRGARRNPRRPRCRRRKHDRRGQALRADRDARSPSQRHLREAARVKVRAAREDETPAIAELIDRHACEGFGESDMSEDEIRHWFSLPNVWILVAEQNGELCGYLDGLTGPVGDASELYACTLDEEAARALLTAAQERVGTGVLRAVAAGGDPVLTAALEEDDWRPVRHTFQMRIDLNGDLPEPSWPEGISVRRFRPGEQRRVYEANTIAFP